MGGPVLFVYPSKRVVILGQLPEQGFELGYYVRKDGSLAWKCSASQLSNIDPFLAHPMYMSDLDVDLGFEIACRKIGVEMDIN